jgi:hypothetical protein
MAASVRVVVVRIIGIGIRIGVARDDPAPSGEVRVEVEPFAELDVNGECRRLGGGFGFATLALCGDPTTELIAAAHTERELNLGNLLGDMRISGFDVTRFELYSAPFRIELTDELREELAGTWASRNPRPDAWAWPPPLSLDS